MCAARFGPEGIEVVNAGHEPLWRGTSSDFEELDITAQPPLGLEGRRRHTSTIIEPLGPDEALCFISDGVTGARDSRGSELGPDAVPSLIERVWAESPLLMARQLIGEILAYSGGQIRDDITSVVVRRYE